MNTQSKRSWVALLLSILLFHTGLYAGVAQAAMVSTQSAMAEAKVDYDRETLMAAIHEEGVRDQLAALGVNPELVEQRVASLTPSELADLNQRVQDMPAGEGVVGVLLTLFIVFIITDMLCATNIFTFVNCINK